MGVQIPKRRYVDEVEANVDQAQLFQSFHSLTVLNQSGQIVSNVAVLDGNGGDFSFDVLQEPDQPFHLSLKTDVFQNQGMEIFPVHFDELANKIGGKIFHIFKLKTFDTVIFKMTFSFIWAMGVFQETTSFGF